MKIKTSELTGTALDWAVATLLPTHYPEPHQDMQWLFFHTDGVPYVIEYGHDVRFEPSFKWDHGGPIIERERINLNYDVHWVYDKDDPEDHGERWYATPCGADLNGFYGSTPLIAAMRCYVASKLGDEVDVPEGLS